MKIICCKVADKTIISANNRINSDWQLRCAPLPAGYAERYTISNDHADPTPQPLLTPSTQTLGQDTHIDAGEAAWLKFDSKIT